MKIKRYATEVNVSWKDITSAVAPLTPIFITVWASLRGYLDTLPRWSVMLLLACTGLLGLYGLDLFRMRKRALRESSMPRRLIIPNGWETIYYYPTKEVLWVIRRQIPWSISR